MNERLNKGDVSFVLIVEQGMTYSDVMELERSLIENEQPKYNIQHTDEYKQRLKDQSRKASYSAKICVAKKVSIDGIVYESLREAGLALGVHQTTITNRLRRQLDGYSYV